ncbi:MAG: porin family protein [Flavobacteriales bacterium]
MKNSILLTLALCTALLTNAQDQVWKIGFKLNPNVSWQKPDSKHMTNEGTNIRLGFSLMVDKHFTDNYALGLGLNIFTTGGKLSYLRVQSMEIPGLVNNYDVISSVNRTYKLQYGEVPFTLKLRTNEIGYITYWGQFGLGLGFNIKAKADDEVDYLKQATGDTGAGEDRWEDSVLESVTTEDEDIKDDIKLFRTSLIIGAGIEYSLSGSTSIIAGFTYNNGFSNAMNGQGVQLDDRDAPIYEGAGENKTPKLFDLKGYTNFVELNVGILF